MWTKLREDFFVNCSEIILMLLTPIFNALHSILIVSFSAYTFRVKHFIFLSRNYSDDLYTYHWPSPGEHPGQGRGLCTGSCRSSWFPPPSFLQFLPSSTVLYFHCSTFGIRPAIATLHCYALNREKRKTRLPYFCLSTDYSPMLRSKPPL